MISNLCTMSGTPAASKDLCGRHRSSRRRRARPQPRRRPGYSPDLIFKRSTVFKWLTPNDKLATYGLDDPEVEGVACHFTVPERGGFKGWLGVAEEVSDISLACRQIGPIRFKAKFEQGEDMFRSAARCSSRRCRSCAAAT